MLTALWLMAIQGVIGAFDTVYYHEYRARLPAMGPGASAELRLHAARDVLYAVIFGTLAWFSWLGGWAVALAAILIAEIALTMMDFVVETVVRKPLGDVYAGERVTHAIMGITYGAMIASLIPVLRLWFREPTAMTLAASGAPILLKLSLTVMSGGVFLSGMRDLYASVGGPYSSWPWTGVKSDTMKAVR